MKEQLNKLLSSPTTLAFKILICYFIICLFYGNHDTSGYWIDSDLPFLKVLLTKNFPTSNSFSFAEWSLILISFYILFRNKGSFVFKPFFIRILLLTFLVFFVMIINPNNRSEIFGIKLIFSGETRFMILFSLLYISFSFLDDKLYSIYINLFLRIGAILLLGICIITFFNFILGRGISFLSVRSTMVDGFSLLLVSIFQILTLIIYLITKKKLFFITSLILLLTLIFSYRRSSLFNSIFSSFVILFFIAFKKESISLFLKRLFAYALTIGLILFILASFSSINIQYLIQRHLAAFSYIVTNESQINDPTLTDTGHLQQSLNTSNTLLSNLDHFWGSGFKNAPFTVKGQSEGGIHNNFAVSWAKHGLFAVFYQLILIIIILRRIILLFRTKFNINNIDFLIFNFGINVILLSYFIIGWTSGLYLFLGGFQSYAFFIIIFTMLKINPSTINNIKIPIKIAFIKI